MMLDMEIVDFFMEEAEELFDGINTILLNNEESGEISKEEIDSLFRNIHTIKGGAGSVGLINLSNYTHHLETFLDSIREGEISFSKDIINFFIDAVSTMQEILEKEYEQDIDAEEIEKLIKDLKDQIQTFYSKNINKNEKEEEKKLVEKNQLDNSASEIVDLFDNIFEILNHIEATNDISNVPINDLFRYVHTLKGSSQFLYLSYFPTYIHDIENILDDIRKNKIKYSIDLNTFLLNSLYIAQEIIDLELNGKLELEKFQAELQALKEEIKKIEKEQDGKEEVPAFELFDDNIPENKMPEFELFDEPVNKKNDKKERVDLVSINTSQTKNSINKEVENHKKSIVKKETTIKKVANSSSIRVNLDKIDILMNRVGDLVITKSMLFQFAENLKNANQEIYKKITEKLDSLDRDIRELQESVMAIRMVPMESVYGRLPKMVRDLAKKLNKKVKFNHYGDNVEIDKMMIEGLMDPLTHIIRNAIDHGIEQPNIRLQKGKSEFGTLNISAAQESGNIILSIQDDGAGINVDKVIQKALDHKVITQEELSKMNYNEKLMLIFSPGLSTAEKVSDVSGRGVGMDVVMNNITSLGGKIEIQSEKDRGTTLKIILPLTLAILDGLNVVIGDRKFILPLSTILESLKPKKHMIKTITKEDRELLMLRDEFIPIVRLYKFFNIQTPCEHIEDGMLIIVKSSNSKVAIFVDDFLNQEQIVVKSLEKNYRKIKGIGAATIRGDGSIGLILDIMNIVEEYKNGD